MYQSEESGEMAKYRKHSAAKSEISKSGASGGSAYI